MSQKTDPSPHQERPEFSADYLVSLVGAAALVLLLIFVVMPMVESPLRIRGPLPWLYGWIVAAGQTIANGLADFSGETPGPVDLSSFAAALVSLLLVGVFAPTLTLLLMRPKADDTAPPGSRGVYFLGLIISMTFAFTVVPTSLVGALTDMRMREAQNAQANKDLMINELNMVAVRVREYRILPQRLGGGDGKTAGYSIPASLAQTQEATYVVTPTGDGVRIDAVSRKVEGAGITVSVTERGDLAQWTYTGRFE